MGGIFNQMTFEGLKHEKRMNTLPLIYRNLRPHGNVHKVDTEDLYTMIKVRGLETFAENMDDVHVSQLVYDFEKLSPYQKKIFVDGENERLFKEIYNKMEGDTLVAVVNQWNVPGIEYFWRHSTRTEEKKEFINPIGDFDISGYAEHNFMNDVQRSMHSKNSKSEPIITEDYQTHYHKMIVESERARHVIFDNTNDPHMDHGLYNEENKDVAGRKNHDGHH